VKEELTRLAIHGALHVMGEDHPDGLDRLESPMFVLQERLLSEVLAGGC
jgi:ssRNA-specific RNase YbeY (16S rRNA maturation enzyme)